MGALGALGALLLAFFREPPYPSSDRRLREEREADRKSYDERRRAAKQELDQELERIEARHDGARHQPPTPEEVDRLLKELSDARKARKDRRS